MPIKVTCPKCQGVLHAPDDAGGKRGKCPTCGTVLSIPAAGAPAAAAPAAPRAMPDAPAFDAPPDPEPEGRRSSFGMAPEPPPPPAAKKAGRVPPPAFGAPEPRKLPDPFARPGKKAAGDPGAGTVKAWKRARGGLWWVRSALFLILLSALGTTGITVAENFGTHLPKQSPGYLGQRDLSSDVEVRLAVLFVPAALGLVCMTLGRFGVSNAPRSSFAKGLASASALATLMVLLGAVALGLPTGLQLAEGFVPVGLLEADEPSGMVQRGGLAAIVVFLPLAELAFVIAMGRMGAGLQDHTLAGRGTRFLVYLGLISAVVAIHTLGYGMYPKEVTGLWNEHVWPQWNKIGEHRPTAVAGLWAAGGLLVWLWYVRLVGAGRSAIRGWLEQNEPGA